MLRSAISFYIFAKFPSVGGVARSDGVVFLKMALLVAFLLYF
jgi:hypothetical protein